ncbi:MAG: hypothetical protein IJT73_09485 [Selenomonadaceae bacterium]|nr:hypothetical protein [Selenomonadaceae bacterium]
MNTSKVVLNNLAVEDYMHPDEKFFASKNPAEIKIIRNAFNLINDVAVKFLRQVTEGKWIEISRQTAPEVLNTLETACSILNYPDLPKIFVRRERDMKIVVGGTEYSQMLVPDYILNEFDSDMQLFVFGNAISMFKAGHVQLSTICSVLCAGVVPVPVILALQAYLRAVDLSSDRGGLLCCQNFSAAARCMLAEIGFPLSGLRFLNDDEILQLVEDYLKQAEAGSFDIMTENAKLFNRVTGDFSPVPFRLRQLLNWYRNGYEQVLNLQGGKA